MSVGHPMNSFYGYKVDGIYKSEEEVKADPIAVANGYKPGYLRYVDIDENYKDAVKDIMKEIGY